LLSLALNLIACSIERLPRIYWQVKYPCFFLFAGCGIAFSTSHKRVWARVTVEAVELGGAAHRNADGFRIEFEEICASIGLRASDSTADLAA
jgi:hypothetical protein